MDTINSQSSTNAFRLGENRLTFIRLAHLNRF